MILSDAELQIFLFILSGLGSIATLSLTSAVVFIYRMSGSINELNAKMAIMISDRDADRAQVDRIRQRVASLEKLSYSTN